MPNSIVLHLVYQLEISSLAVYTLCIYSIISTVYICIILCYNVHNGTQF